MASKPRPLLQAPDLTEPTSSDLGPYRRGQIRMILDFPARNDSNHKRRSYGVFRRGPSELLIRRRCPDI